MFPFLFGEPREIAIQFKMTVTGMGNIVIVVVVLIIPITIIVIFIVMVLAAEDCLGSRANSKAVLSSRSQVCVRWTPHPVIVTIRGNKDYIRVLLYSYYTTITGWGVLLRSANTDLP